MSKLEALRGRYYDACAREDAACSLWHEYGPEEDSVEQALWAHWNDACATSRAAYQRLTAATRRISEHSRQKGRRRK